MTLADLGYDRKNNNNNDDHPLAAQLNGLTAALNRMQVSEYQFRN
jgi:hypothetical protein